MFCPFSSPAEQRLQSNTTENIKELEDKQTSKTKTNREIIKRQKQLTCQLLEEIEKHWEERERERNEIEYLRTKTDEQQKDIDRLTAEKHEQSALIKTLKLKIENVIEKLKENKNEAIQDKLQLQKMQAEIHQERESLGRRHIEIINERHKLEMIKSDKPRQESKEPKEHMVKREREIVESLLSAMNKNKKMMLETKEQTEESLENIKKELKSSKNDIAQHKDEIELIKHNMILNINKMKQRWTKVYRDIQIQKAGGSEVETRERQTKGKDTFGSVKEKLGRIREEMETLWEILEDREKENMSKKTKETEHAAQDEGDGQRSEVDEHEIEQQVDRTREIKQHSESQFDEDDTEASTTAGMQRVISEIQGVREMLRMVREDARQREKILAEEKSQSKWKNFQDKKKRRKLEQWQEKVIKERDELEIMKIKMDRQREEVGQKVEDVMSAVQTMAERNANIEKAVREINYTQDAQEEMLRAQRQMEKNQEEVKVHMVSRYFFLCH